MSTHVPVRDVVPGDLVEVGYGFAEVTAVSEGEKPHLVKLGLIQRSGFPDSIQLSESTTVKITPKDDRRA